MRIEDKVCIRSQVAPGHVEIVIVVDVIIGQILRANQVSDSSTLLNLKVQVDVINRS